MQFESSVSDVQSTAIVCSDCGKKYKSSGGYHRHRTTKHNDQQQQLPLTPVVLAEIVNGAVKKVKENKVFNADLRDELKQYEYGQLTETEECSVFKILFDGYLKNGDREKFYGKYYAQVPLKSTSFSRGLSQNAATLLAIKVADSMLAHCRQCSSIQNCLIREREGRVMYCTIFTKRVQESFQMKASKRCLFSKLGNWSMALTHKSWFPVWTVVVSGL